MGTYKFNVYHDIWNKRKKLTNSADTVVVKSSGIWGANLECLSGNDKITVYKNGVYGSNIYMGKGDDKVYVYDGSYNNSKFYLGYGNDYFETKKSSGTNRDLSYTVYGQYGTNTYKLTTGEDLIIHGGTGVDKFTVIGTAAKIDGFKLYGGKGADQFYIKQGNVGSSRSEYDALKIFGEAGNDKIYVGTTSGKYVKGYIYSISGGSGSDLISVGKYFKGSIINSISGGSGNDKITIKPAISASISGGSGDDKITVGTTSGGIDAGSGNDKITVSKVAAGSYVDFTGGLGTDTISVSNMNRGYIHGDKSYTSTSDQIKYDVSSCNDVISVSSCTDVNIYGDGGQDKITVSNSVNCDIYSNYSASNIDKYSDIVVVKGNSYNNDVNVGNSDRVYLASGHDNHVDIAMDNNAAIWVDLTKSNNNSIDAYFSKGAKINLYIGNGNYQNFNLSVGYDSFNFVISYGSQTIKIDSKHWSGETQDAPTISFQTTTQAKNNTATTFSGSIFNMVSSYGEASLSFRDISYLASTGAVKSSAFNYSATSQFITGTK